MYSETPTESGLRCVFIVSETLAWYLYVCLEQDGNRRWSESRNSMQAIAQPEEDVLRPCNANIQKTLELVEEMITLADKGDLEREDVGCGIMYGIMRDAAYKLKQIAEKEKLAHIQKGWWDPSCWH